MCEIDIPMRVLVNGYLVGTIHLSVKRIFSRPELKMLNFTYHMQVFMEKADCKMLTYTNLNNIHDLTIEKLEFVRVDCMSLHVLYYAYCTRQRLRRGKRPLSHM